MRRSAEGDGGNAGATGEHESGPAPIVCPFCGAADAERLSLFGSQLLTEQYYCRACHTPFEHIKDDVRADMESQ